MHKIMIVDDYVDLTHVMKIFLKGEGYEVEECAKAEDVFKKIYAFSPDLIILDVYLDGESGRSLCMKIKSLTSTKNIPVILYSAHNFPPDYLEGCNNDDFIQKPFELSELKKKIEFHLAMRDKVSKSAE